MVTFKNDFRLREKYDGRTYKGLQLVDQEKYGLEKRSNWYGGNMQKTAIVPESGIFLALTQDMETLGVGYYDEELLSDEDREYFGLELRKTMVSEEEVAKELDEEKQIVLTPSTETVKIVSNKVNVPQNNIKRKR